MSWVEVLAAWPGAAFLRGSGTAYLLVNATHILGLGLLVGAILPLDLRLAGLFAQAPLAVLGPFLSRFAAAGLCLALVSGAWLFTVNPKSYLANPAFLWKLGLVAFALVNTAVQHASAGYRRALAGEPPATGVRVRAIASLLAWLGALLAGRWIGFL